MRIDSELQKLKNEEREAIRDMGKLNAQMDILSSKLYKKKKNHELEEGQCEMNHNELIEKLRVSYSFLIIKI